MSQISKSPSYLIRNPHSYCFRINIPKDLQPIIGRKELRRSLKTGYLSVAKVKARVMAGNLQMLFMGLRKETAVADFPFDHIDLILDQISYAVSGITEKILRQNLDEPLTQEQIQKERNRLEDEIQQIRDELSRSDYSRISPIVLGQFQKAGVPLSSEHPRFKELCREFQKAEIKRLKLELERERGDYSTDERKYYRANCGPSLKIISRTMNRGNPMIVIRTSPQITR